MDVNYAPAPKSNPLALALALRGAQTDGGSTGSDMEAALRKMMLEKYLGSVGDYSPVQHWTQGLARMANAGIAGYQLNKLLDEDKKSNAEVGAARRSMLDTLTGGATGASKPVDGPVPVPSMPTPAISPMGALPGMGGGTGEALGIGGPPMPSQGSVGGGAPPAALAAAIGGSDQDTKPVPFNQPPFPQYNSPEPMPPSQTPLPPPRPQADIPNGVMSPTMMADQAAPLTGGNPAQGVDRSRIAQEIQQNPALIKRLADMVNGEVTLRDPKMATIQAESAADRALTRNIPLAQALLAVNQDPKRGYYASDTYSRPANPQQLADFQQNILPQVLGGSEVGMQTLGFRPTGNASQLGFAQRRADQGMYDAYKWPSGVPGKGEMYALEKGDAARQAKNLRSNFPPELLSPQSPVLDQPAPVQVASTDPMSGIPSQPQVGNGSFAPGSLPNVRDMAVRPTGPANSTGTMQPPAPQVAQAQMQPNAAQRPISQVPPQIAAQVRTMLSSPNRKVQELGWQMLQQYAKPVTPKYEKLNDDTLYEQNTGSTKPVGPGYHPLVDPAERAKYGIPATDQRPYQVGPANKLINPPPENRINIDQRGELAFDQAAAKHQAERFDKIVQSGFDAKANRADLTALRDIGSRITTGKTAEVTAALGPYAEALGVKIDGLGDMQAYSAIISKLAPRMRVVGSGATSDYEMRQFLNALPGLGKTPEGNALIEQTMEALQNHQERAAEIASRAMNKEIKPGEADKLLRELPDPMTAWKAQQKAKQGTSAGGSVPRAVNPTTGQTIELRNGQWVPVK